MDSILFKEHIANTTRKHVYVIILKFSCGINVLHPKYCVLYSFIKKKTIYDNMYELCIRIVCIGTMYYLKTLRVRNDNAHRYNNRYTSNTYTDLRNVKHINEIEKISTS